MQWSRVHVCGFLAEPVQRQSNHRHVLAVFFNKSKDQSLYIVKVNVRRDYKEDKSRGPSYLCSGQHRPVHLPRICSAVSNIHASNPRRCYQTRSMPFRDKNLSTVCAIFAHHLPVRAMCAGVQTKEHFYSGQIPESLSLSMPSDLRQSNATADQIADKGRRRRPIRCRDMSTALVRVPVSVDLRNRTHSCSEGCLWQRLL
jgi:hypothetical protein